MDERTDLYGESFADVYDEWYGNVSDVAAMVEALGRMTAGRRVLELGVGTGRLALPLSAAGFEVTGLDSSASMLERLAINDATASVRAIQGDMADFELGESFDVVLIAFNTLFNLATPEAQHRCIAAVASHLTPDGLFLVEAIVPSTETTGSERGLSHRHLDDGGLVLTATVTDHDDQTTVGNHVHLTRDGRVRLRPWVVRHSTPGQLDDMAAAAGLELRDRRADWNGTAFDDTCVQHVSVYGRPPAAATASPD